MKLELSLHAIDLKNVDGIHGKSDPYAVVTSYDGPTPASHIIGQTEVIQNTLNPEWVTPIIIDGYELGRIMKIIVTIYDDRGKNKDASVSLGSVIYEIGDLLGSRGNCSAKRLPKRGTTIFATIRPYNMATSSQNNGTIRLKLKANELKSTEGFMRKSDPFYEISRQARSTNNLTWDNIYRSNVVHDNLDPTWDVAVIELYRFMIIDSENDTGNSNSSLDDIMNAPIRIDIYDYEAKGNHVLMGYHETTLSLLKDAKTSATTLKLKKKNDITGNLIVLQADVETSTTTTTSSIETGLNAIQIKDNKEEMNKGVTSTSKYNINNPPTFVDYITGGCQLNVVVAVDFTGSNGNPTIPGTLHYYDPNGIIKNDYVKAISSIIEILSKYDYDQNYPTYGFGAKYDGIVNHCFALNNHTDINNANCHGLNGILDSYKNVFKTGFIMSSPTVFTDIFEKAAYIAKENNKKQELTYTILLIVTDGAVSDINTTKQCIETISKDHNCPLSIVIVGVGNADFTSMQFLDDSSGQERDIAQFVEFQKYHDNKSNLTSATLNEIPNQLVKYYYTINHIEPGIPIQILEQDIVVDDVEEEDIVFTNTATNQW